MEDDHSSELVFKWPQDGSVRAKLIQNELYEGELGKLIGFINEDGSCGNAQEVFLGSIDSDGIVTNSCENPIGIINADLCEIRTAQNALLASISANGFMKDAPGNHLLIIEGFSSRRFLQVASYLLLFDTQILRAASLNKEDLKPLSSPSPSSLPLHRFPSNFSFVPLDANQDETQASGPSSLIGMAIPTSMQQVEALKEHLGVRLICSFIEPHRAPPESFFEGVVDEHISVSWGDMSASLDLAQLEGALRRANEVISSGGSVAFHCYAGMGRTGTALALFLVKYRGFSPTEAIRTIRQARPGSIETEAQESLIESFGDTYKS